MGSEEIVPERIEITNVEGVHEAGPWLESVGIPTRGEILAIHGQSSPERTSPQNPAESAAGLYLDLLRGPFRVVATPVQGGVEVFFKGRVYFVPEGKSVLIMADDSPLDSCDEAGKDE
jgi:hypothetical protein